MHIQQQEQEKKQKTMQVVSKLHRQVGKLVGWLFTGNFSVKAAKAYSKGLEG